MAEGNPCPSGSAWSLAFVFYGRVTGLEGEDESCPIPRLGNDSSILLNNAGVVKYLAHPSLAQTTSTMQLVTADSIGEVSNWERDTKLTQLAN